jgi:hypothetical protein
VSQKNTDAYIYIVQGFNEILPIFFVFGFFFGLERLSKCNHFGYLFQNLNAFFKLQIKLIIMARPKLTQISEIRLYRVKSRESESQIALHLNFRLESKFICD